MQATLQLPERFGREHQDAVSSILREFQDERARFQGFTEELSTEWQHLCDDLSRFSDHLQENERELGARDEELVKEMQVARESQLRADEIARQLLATQAELAACREQMDRVQRERAAVRQQIQDVNSGVLSLSELIRIVQSAYSELENVQAALGQQANELMSSVDGPRLAAVCETDECPPADESDAHDQAEEASESADAFSDAEDSFADPVVGSVLAELTRLGKQL